MTRNCFLAAILLSAFGAPPAYRVRFAIQGASSVNPDVARITAALQQGLYRDSLVVPGDDSLFNLPAIHSDTAWRLPHGRMVVAVGSVVARADSLDIQLRLMNILRQPLTALETLHVARAQVDSVLSERGRSYARVLAAIHR